MAAAQIVGSMSAPPPPPPWDRTFAGRANSITLQELRLSCSGNSQVRFYNKQGELEDFQPTEASLAIHVDDDDDEEGPLPLPLSLPLPPVVVTIPPPSTPAPSTPPTLPLCFCTERCWTFRSSAKYLGGVLGALAAVILVLVLL